MSLINAFKIIKNEGMSTFGHVLKEKMAEREDDNRRYNRIINTTEKEIKECYKNVTESIFGMVDLTDISSISNVIAEVKKTDFEYVGFKSDSFYLEEDALKVLTSVSSNLRRAGLEYDLFYSDEDFIDEKNNRFNPIFKADYSVDTLYSYNYIGEGFFANKEKILLLLEELAREEGDEIKDISLLRYKLLIMLSMNEVKAFHVNCCLVHNVSYEEKGHDYMKAMAELIIQEHKKLGEELTVVTKDIKGEITRKNQIFTALNYLYYKTGNEKVSIIIPSKDNPELVKKCIKAIDKYTTVTNYEIVLVDNGSNDENKSIIEEFVRKSCEENGHSARDIKYVYDKRDFNFSYMCNLGARHASGEYYLFLNDDVEIIDNDIPNGFDWLSVMLGFASRSLVGTVGVKLLYPDKKSIQHVGIVNYEEAGFAHIHAREDDLQLLGQYRNRANMNVLCVTAAAVLVSAKKFWQVGGFNEDLVVTHNDVELGLKLYEAGYNNVLVNSVKLIHHESLTRGLDGESEEKSRRNMKERELTFKLHPYLKKRDPFYSEYLTQMEFNERVNYSRIYDEDMSELIKADNKSKIYLRDENGKIKARITAVALRDKLEIRGYAYRRDGSNKKALKISYLIEGVNDSYIAEAKNKCDRVAHQRLGLEKNCNFAENYCNLNPAKLKAGNYKIKMICDDIIVAVSKGVSII